jgi:hypothetical protein
MGNYLIVLFKNKKKKKIINKFLTFDKANKFFEKQIKSSNEIIFSKQIVSGKDSEFELSIVGDGKISEQRIYLKDEFGRNTQVKIEDENMSIIRISPIKVEELIYDFQQKMKISFSEFEKKYLKKDGVKLVSGLNNKVVVQSDDLFNIFTMKTIEECNRFLDCLSNHLFKNKRIDCLVVKDSSTAQKKYLYTLLVSKGFEKQFLYRKFTYLVPTK